MAFRIFKENGLDPDECVIQDMADAVRVYNGYFSDGYTVRVLELETGQELYMDDGKLIPSPYFQRAASHR